MHERFVRLWRRIGATGGGSDVFDQLCKAYGEPHRSYHNLDHVAFCLDELDRAAAAAKDADALAMALWFHDAVYDPHVADNEQRSAAWAADTLNQHGVPRPFVDRVVMLIDATRHVATPTEPDAQFIVDIDLATLGQDGVTYDRYETGIRSEYAHVPWDVFARERTKILRRLMGRSAIYCLAQFRERYEDQARMNLARAITQLGVSRNPDATEPQR